MSVAAAASALFISPAMTLAGARPAVCVPRKGRQPNSREQSMVESTKRGNSALDGIRQNRLTRKHVECGYRCDVEGTCFKLWKYVTLRHHLIEIISPPREACYLRLPCPDLRLEYIPCRRRTLDEEISFVVSIYAAFALQAHGPDT